MDFVFEWSGCVVVDGVIYPSGHDVPPDVIKGGSKILLKTAEEYGERDGDVSKGVADKTYCIEVKPYMLKEATPSFDFMQKWNNNIPMPFKIMVGTIDKETNGMYHCNLHCEILEEQTTRCLKCGRALENPVSMYFGVGPECGGHNYVNPFNSDEELRAAVESYKLELAKKTWSGWIIKSAIIRMEEI